MGWLIYICVNVYMESTIIGLDIITRSNSNRNSKCLKEKIQLNDCLKKPDIYCENLIEKLNVCMKNKGPNLIYNQDK